MTLRTPNVVVHQAPAAVAARDVPIHCRQFVSTMDTDRPSLVLDCSHVQRLDRSLMDLLLCTLEEAMKRNGDVKLAAFSAALAPELESAGIHRLFDVFTTVREASESYSQTPVKAASEAIVPLCAPHAAVGSD